MTRYSTTSPVARRGYCRRTGYSLIELLMVLAIAAIAAGIVLPRFGHSQARYGAEAAAKRVAADLALAQTRARATSKSQVVSFTAGSSKYTLPGAVGLDRSSTTYAVDLSAGTYAAVVTSADFGGAAVVTFDRYGAPSSGGTVVVRAGSTQRTVVLDATTGRATVP